MKRNPILRLATALLVGALLFLFARHLRLGELTFAELSAKTAKPAKPPEPPVDCSGASHAIGQLAALGHKVPTRNTLPLPTDEIAIYRTIVSAWIGSSKQPVHVSDETYPLSLTSIANDFSDCSCSAGFPVESFLEASRSSHNLTRGTLPDPRIRLVNAYDQAKIVSANDPGKTMAEGHSVVSAVNHAFSTGLFSMSEIAFDSQHRRALVSYGFICGGLCGSGATLLFENIHGEWEQGDHRCGGWVS